MTKRFVSAILASSLTFSLTAQAESCLIPYQQLKTEKEQAHKALAAGGGVAAVGAVAGIGMIVVGSTGVGAVVLVVMAGGGLFLAYRKHNEEIRIAHELSVLELYKQAQAHVQNPSQEIGPELQAFIESVNQVAGHPKKDISEKIIQGMESGFFCSTSYLMDTAELMIDLGQDPEAAAQDAFPPML